MKHNSHFSKFVENVQPCNEKLLFSIATNLIIVYLQFYLVPANPQNSMSQRPPVRNGWYRMQWRARGCIRSVHNL